MTGARGKANHYPQTSCRYTGDMASVDLEDRLAAIFIAIDFGTVKSGYSFAVGAKGDVTISRTIKKYPSKDYTVIMLNRADNSFREFGKLALEKYENMDDDEKERVFVFKRFKMELLKDSVSAITNSQISQTRTWWMILTEQISNENIRNQLTSRRKFNKTFPSNSLL